MGSNEPTFAFPLKTAPSLMNNLFFLATVLLFAAGCQSSQPTETATVGLPYYDEATFTPHWEHVNNTSFHTIPPFRLTNQYGETITEHSLDGFERLIQTVGARDEHRAFDFREIYRPCPRQC